MSTELICQCLRVTPCEFQDSLTVVKDAMTNTAKSVEGVVDFYEIHEVSKGGTHTHLDIIVKGDAITWAGLYDQKRVRLVPVEEEG